MALDRERINVRREKMQTFISVETVRFHLEDKNKLIVQYVYRGDEPEANKLRIFLDDNELTYEVQEYSGIDVSQRYARYAIGISKEYYALVTLPKNYTDYKKFTLKIDNSTSMIKIGELKISDIIKKQDSVDYCIDNIAINDKNEIDIRGWYISKMPADIQICDENGNKIDVDIKYSYRNDVTQAYKETSLEGKYGFEIKTAPFTGKTLMIMIQCGDDCTKKNFTIKEIKNFSNSGKINIRHNASKAYRYMKHHGMKRTLKKVYAKVFKVNLNDYTKFVKKHQPSQAEIDRQRQTKFEYEPVFSIIIPLYKTNKKFLAELLESLISQTYGRFEICLSDGSGDKTILKDILEQYKQKDSRIKYSQLDKAAQISENTNNALKLATGDYIVLCDHDDLVPEYALYECAKAINENRNIDILYSDEDKIDMEGKKYFEPHFKPDFNIDLLRSVNYICHLFVAKKTIVDKIGGFRSEFDGAQDYDFIFRCSEQAECIYHIPKVLYHWRAHIDSTAENPESKLYAFDAGRRAIAAHLERIGIKGHVTDGAFYGIYRTHYDIIGEPKISIVIPNKDHIEDLYKCMNSIITKSSYKNYEFVIVENNSTEKETFEFYEKIQKEYDNVKVLYWKDEFNYSAINNFGVKEADGEYILLLNNDTEIINDDCLSDMLSICQREEVGIVGARLYYPDDTIQHAGVVIGFGGIAGHTFIGQPRFEPGYFARAMCTQDYSAVTAACMMTKKSVFEEVGGLTEEFKVAFNDIDYCMKVRKLGKLVVYDAFAELYHYESKSRGLEDTPEKVARFNSEIERFRDRWEDILEKGDPYYNPNLTLDKSDFSLREY